MTFKIHYNGDYEDSIIIKGETSEEIREKVFAECVRRGWNRIDCWCERVD